MPSCYSGIIKKNCVRENNLFPVSVWNVMLIESQRCLMLISQLPNQQLQGGLSHLWRHDNTHTCGCGKTSNSVMGVRLWRVKTGWKWLWHYFMFPWSMWLKRFFSQITSSEKIQTHKQHNQSLSYSNDYSVSCCLSLYFGSHTSCTAEKQPLFAATTHNKRQAVMSHSRRSFCLSLHHKNALNEL